MTTAYAEPAIPYATPAAGGPSPVVAGVWICVAGVALVFFAGCFCIGILLLTSNAFYGGLSLGPKALTAEQEALMVGLYAMAAACVGGGGLVLVLGLRKLLSVGR